LNINEKLFKNSNRKVVGEFDRKCQTNWKNLRGMVLSKKIEKDKKKSIVGLDDELNHFN
jgi:hypothetical protein